MIDLNKLQRQIASGEVKTDKDKESSLLQPKHNSYEQFLAFKNASPEEQERIAAENDTTVVAYEGSLERKAILRGEFPEKG